MIDMVVWAGNPHRTATCPRSVRNELAKKLYTNCTAAVLRAKECVMKTATTIQENAEDIYAEAQQINEDRAAQAAKEYDGEAEAAETATEE